MSYNFNFNGIPNNNNGGNVNQFNPNPIPVPGNMQPHPTVMQRAHAPSTSFGSSNEGYMFNTQIHSQLMNQLENKELPPELGEGFVNDITDFFSDILTPADIVNVKREPGKYDSPSPQNTPKAEKKPEPKYLQQYETEAEKEMKRSSHIASEQKRRDNIKEGFINLRSRLPPSKDSSSRAVLLRKATEYIDVLKKQNKQLSEQLQEQRKLSDVKSPGSATGAPVEDELTYNVLVDAVEKRLHIRSKHPEKNIQFMYKDEEQLVDISSQEDLDDLFRKYSNTDSKYVKLNVYIPKPKSIGGQGLAEPAQTRLHTEPDDGDLVNDLDADDDDEEDVIEMSQDVNVEVVNQLYELLKNNPQSCLGGAAFRNPDWQKARIYRFVKACNSNFKHARKMLELHLEWLETYKPEQVIVNDIIHEMSGNKLYWYKTDRQGRPVLIFQLRKHRVSERDKYETIRHWIYMIQQFIDRMSNPYKQFIFIYDRSGTTRSNADVPALKKFVKIFQQNYPELLHCMYVIQPDYVFKYGWNLVAKFTSKTFRKKVVMLENKEVLAEKIGPENLLKEFGGNDNSWEYKFNENDPSTYNGVLM